MIMRKTARTAWANIFRGVLLALTLELPWPGWLGWLWDIVNCASFVLVFGSAAVLFMWGALNACRLITWALTDDPPYESTRDRLLREYREETAPGTDEDAQVVLARIAFTNQQADDARSALERTMAVLTASGTPVRSGKTLVRPSAECDECGEPMDSAWVPSGFPRLCTPCLTHGIASYAPPCRPGFAAYPCDGCGKRLIVNNVLPGAAYLCSACDNN